MNNPREQIKAIRKALREGLNVVRVELQIFNTKERPLSKDDNIVDREEKATFINVDIFDVSLDEYVAGGEVAELQAWKSAYHLCTGKEFVFEG